MSLDLPPSARFPRAGTMTPVPKAAVDEFIELLTKIAPHTNDRQRVLEHFKSCFCRAIHIPHHWSSGLYFVEHDLRNRMDRAASNPALFLEALYDSIETVRVEGKYHVPPLDRINEICRQHELGYEIQPPNLVECQHDGIAVPKPSMPRTLTEEAAQILNESMDRAEQLLEENRPREAVQEMLWMLESLATAFRGTAIQSGEVRGKYFNEIAKELRASAPDATLQRVIEWLVQLHGYLSSPTGGGVRHGRDLQRGTPISNSDGRLFVNLVLSYVTYLLTEHERLVSGETGV
jgi:hypothetical protein